MELEKEFEARIAQAKEAARLASIAAAARTSNASNGPPFSAVSSVPIRPPPAPQSAATVPEPFPPGYVPADVKNRIDRLLEFTARNGDAFEETARKREQDNPDFGFLKPGGPFSDYYQWKKQQMSGNAIPVAASSINSGVNSAPRGPLSSPHAVPTIPVIPDPLGEMSVGAMANVCKYANVRRVPPYAPIPHEILVNVGNLPPVEPARLEIRLSEFYRDEDR